MVDEFGLFDRIVTPEVLAEKERVELIDYNKVNKIVSQRRMGSIDFLNKALKMEKH